MNNTIFSSVCFLISAVLICAAGGCAKQQQTAEVHLPVVEVEEAASVEVQPFIYGTAYAEAYEFVKITARVKGFLREINYKPGEIVSAGQQLFLIEPDQYKGASVETTEYPFTGKLDAVSNTIDRSTGTIEVRGIIPNEDFAVFPGQICRFRIPAGEKKEQIVIKQEALRRDLNKVYIFTVDKDNTAHKQYIETGGEQPDGTRVVLSGLQKGERYIVKGAAKARDGKKVEIKSVK